MSIGENPSGIKLKLVEQGTVPRWEMDPTRGLPVDEPLCLVKESVYKFPHLTPAEREFVERVEKVKRHGFLVGEFDKVCDAVPALAKRLEEALAGLEQIKERIHFIGMPQEAVWEWRPDWRKEIAMIERLLKGELP